MASGLEYRERVGSVSFHEFTRKAPVTRGLDKALFDGIAAQHKMKAIRVRIDTPVDATIITSAGEAHPVKHEGKPARHRFKYRKAVSAFIATDFAHETQQAGGIQIACRRRPDPVKAQRFATIVDEGENDMLACMSFPKEHRDQPGDNNPIERLIDAIKRPTDIVGMSTNAETTIGLVGGLLLEQDGRARRRGTAT